MTSVHAECTMYLQSARTSKPHRPNRPTVTLRYRTAYQVRGFVLTAYSANWLPEARRTTAQAKERGGNEVQQHSLPLHTPVIKVCTFCVHVGCNMCSATKMGVSPNAGITQCGVAQSGKQTGASHHHLTKSEVPICPALPLATASVTPYPPGSQNAWWCPKRATAHGGAPK